MNLFQDEEAGKRKRAQPLAFRMRPGRLEDFKGHPEISGSGGFLRKALEKGVIPSMIFWGPPGSGKTTLAAIAASFINADFESLSAVTSGIKDVKAVMERAKNNISSGKKTILFLDEIHRFNKAQQDAFLPFVEDGTIILMGATTENPSFEVNSALLSRMKVIILKPLDREALKEIIENAVRDAENGLGKRKIKVEEEVYDMVDVLSNGDARAALNIIEIIDSLKQEDEYTITPKDVKYAAEKKSFMYDKKGEEHYNLISVLHKSMRDSDPDAAAYWAVRMIQSGEDPLYIARRMIRFASEDIGMADTNALLTAIAARDAYHMLGSPEGDLSLVHAAVYLACAPKSNAVYAAENRIKQDLKEFRDEPVPISMRNAPTKLMKETGYGKGYKYAHDYEGGFVKQQHLPDKLKNRRYYNPAENGNEKAIKERLEKWRKE